MADETNIDASILEEGLDFANLITGDEPAGETPPVETPPVETPPIKEVKPEESPPAAEEDENPFKTDENAEKPATKEEEIPEKPGTPDAWSRLKESRDRHKTAADEKETLLREKEVEVIELKVKAARVTELEEKLRTFDEYEKELAVTRIESTREYKETIEAPLDAIGEQVEILATSNEGDMVAVKRMLVEADPAKQRAMLKEITSGWDEIDRIDLKKMTEDARTILDKQDAMRANSHATAKEQQQIAAQREAEQKEVQKKEFAKATGDVVKSLREKMPFVALAEGETEDDRYSVLAQKVAQVDFASQTPRAQALAVASTFALPQAIKTIGLKDAEIASLKEALAKATGGKPSVNTKADIVPDDADVDFFDAMGIPQPKAVFGPQ